MGRSFVVYSYLATSFGGLWIQINLKSDRKVANYIPSQKEV
jgi:hypothetical protein